MQFGAKGLGQPQEARPKGQFPAKQKGKHRWTMIATFAVTAESLKAASRQDENHTILDTENLVALMAGCIDCEEEWPAPEPCTGYYDGFDV